MQSIDKLLEVIDRLLGPGGCPWDQKQTLNSLREGLLEEVCEVIDAINLGDAENIREELGDLLFNALFFCRIAEKENVGTMQDIAQAVTDKLIRRHPHVFGKDQYTTEEEHLKRWEALKQEEKKTRKTSSLLDRIPKQLPALARAYEILNAQKKTGLGVDMQSGEDAEMKIGSALEEIVKTAFLQGIDPEQALRKYLIKKETAFRENEKNRSSS